MVWIMATFLMDFPGELTGQGLVPIFDDELFPEWISETKYSFRIQILGRLAERLGTMAASFSGRGINPPKTGHHFLHLDDFSKDELWAFLHTAKTIKAKLKNGDQEYKPWAGKTLAMVFQKPSLRTRVSFETVSVSKNWLHT